MYNYGMDYEKLDDFLMVGSQGYFMLSPVHLLLVHLLLVHLLLVLVLLSFAMVYYYYFLIKSKMDFT